MPHYQAAAGFIGLCIVFLQGTIFVSSTDVVPTTSSTGVPTSENLRGPEEADDVPIDTDHHYPHPYPPPDCEPPDITAPPDTTIECGDDTSSHNTGGAFVASKCPVRVSESDTSTPGCGFTEVIDRLFKVEDKVGQTAQDMQIITVEDTIEPEIEAPADITVECGTGANIDPTEEGAGVPTVSDICSDDDEIETRSHDVFKQLCGEKSKARVITRTWKAIDECGLMNTDDQLITVEDTTDPFFDQDTFPPGNETKPLRIVCNKETLEDDIDPENTGTPTASDLCSYIPDPTFMDKSHPLCGHDSHTQTIKRTWTATDPCGNSVSQNQIIQVFDKIKPVFETVPGDTTVECESDTSPENTGGEPTATDNCDDVTFDFSDNSEDGRCGKEKVIDRTWTAMDKCWNTATADQEITTIDTTPPSIIFTEDCPQFLHLVCDKNMDPAEEACEPMVNDICSYEDEIMLDSEDTEYDGCGGTVSIRRLWTATDQCGLTNEAKQYITTEDETPPEFDMFPGDKHIECDRDTKEEDLMPEKTGRPTAMDECNEEPDVDFQDHVELICHGNKIITRTWTADDECGNTVSRNQIITLDDTMPPVFTSFPPDITGECLVDHPNNALSITSKDDVPTAEDTCSDVTISAEYSSVPGCGYTEVITRTWIAEDDCKNAVSQNQTINITDTTPPVLNDFPADVTVECNLETIDEDTDPANTGEPTPFDTCSKHPTVHFEDKDSPKCGGTTVITRMWFAEDECGNESDRQDQIIEVVDTTDPEFDYFPPDVYVECGDCTSPQCTGEPTATDNCDDHVIITHVNASVPGCGLTETITRTWTATDDCGLSVDRDQKIFVKDTTPPKITCPPDVTIKCDDFHKDDCRKDQDDHYKDDDRYGKDDDYYDSKDDDYYKDYKPYDPYCPTGVATAYDKCGDIKYIDFEDTITSGYDCYKTPQIITRTWKAKDECGNVATCDQIITLHPKDYKDPYESYDAGDGDADDGVKIEDIVRTGDNKEQDDKDAKEKEKAAKEAAKAAEKAAKEREKAAKEAAKNARKGGGRWLFF